MYYSRALFYTYALGAQRFLPRKIARVWNRAAIVVSCVTFDTLLFFRSSLPTFP